MQQRYQNAEITKIKLQMYEEFGKIQKMIKKSKVQIRNVLLKEGNQIDI